MLNCQPTMSSAQILSEEQDEHTGGLPVGALAAPLRDVNIVL